METAGLILAAHAFFYFGLAGKSALSFTAGMLGWAGMVLVLLAHVQG